MPDYMVLLYTPESDEDERQEDRWAEISLWNELTRNLQDAGLLVAHGPLHPVTTATTVRVRDGATELTDGPFATTKEVLMNNDHQGSRSRSSMLRVRISSARPAVSNRSR